MNLLKKLIRRLIVGKKQEFAFKKVQIDTFCIPNIKKSSMYIHVPFCKSMCPYCPYNRVQYDEKLIAGYFNALSEEIDLYSKKLGKIEISSIYIGGGTPTNAIDELIVIIEKIKDKFYVEGDIAIETTVEDATNETLLKLKLAGINMISIGIQSFNEKYLRILGRNYSGKDIENAIENTKKHEFDNVNIDIMFAFPGQTDEEILDDIKRAKQTNADQITTYPLFTFPYSTIGTYLKIKKLKMPDFIDRKSFYYLIYDYFKTHNYKTVSVWSFKKSNTEKKYSSVTRDYYIGLGAGAASRIGKMFYFNTFSISEYNNRLLNEKKLPVSVNMSITDKLSKIYWFYWKLYETRFSEHDFNSIADRKMKFIVKIFYCLKLIKKQEGIYKMTKRGAFWIHFFQNHFMLEYINKVWSIMKNNKYPEKIKF